MKLQSINVHIVNLTLSSSTLYVQCGGAYMYMHEYLVGVVWEVVIFGGHCWE